MENGSAVVQRTASPVDAADFFLGHGARAVHDERKTREARLDRLDTVKVKPLLAAELVRAVAGADGDSEAIATGELDEALGVVRVSQHGVFFVDVDVFFDTT